MDKKQGTLAKLSTEYVISPNFYFLQFVLFFRAFTSTSVSIWPRHSCATLGKVLLQHIAPANPGEIGREGGEGEGGREGRWKGGGTEKLGVGRR